MIRNTGGKTTRSYFLSLDAALILALALMKAIISASACGSPVKGMSKALDGGGGGGLAAFDLTLAKE